MYLNRRGPNILTTILTICGLSCQPQRSEIQDVIQPVILTAGESETLLVSDLFFAEDYHGLKFDSNPNVDVNYERNADKVALTPKDDFDGMAVVAFTLHGRDYAIPVRSHVRQTHIFTFQPRQTPDFRMNIMGTFNGWDRNSLPMHDENGDGIYEIELKLMPGQYLYQFVIDSTEIWDPRNPDRVDNGFGSYNSVVSIPPRHTAKTFLHVLGFEATVDQTTLSFFYERENQPGPLQKEQIIALQNNQVIPLPQIKISGNRIEISLKNNEVSGRQLVRLVVNQDGLSTNMQSVWLQDGRPPGNGQRFSSWHDAILYSIMIDRFYDGDTNNTRPVIHDSLSPKANYMGGDLQGILDKIEAGYFDSLGVNTLWISPVNENTDKAFREWPPPHRYFSGYHGYWSIHHQRVEERFGDLRLLKRLIAEAHKHDIKVLLDFIANHVHIDHPFYQNHRDWFGTLELADGRKNIRFWDEFRLTTWFEPFMPSFDYVGSDQALATMTDNAIWWLKQTKADGFRHDAVKHIPNRFWRVLTRKIKREIGIPGGKQLFQIGETFGGYDLISSYVNNGQLNAQFNFNLYDTALYTFLNPDVSFSVLDRELHKTLSVYGANHLMGNVMDSHDKIRYMAYADGDLALSSSDAQEIGWNNPPQVDNPASYAKAKLYLAYLLTIPGVPTLYYGDEIGMTGAADPDNRRMMRFDEQLTEAEQQMLRDVQNIVKIRRNHSALRYGDFQTLLANEKCFAYVRADVYERILVVLNKSERRQRFDLEIPAFYEIKAAGNVLTGEEINMVENKLDLEISATSWQVYELISERVRTIQNAK